LPGDVPFGIAPADGLALIKLLLAPADADFDFDQPVVCD
jgi:hypothetical protein